MQVESVPIASLLPDPSNVRRHAAKNLDAIKGSLAKFGQQKPIVVGKNNVVIAGNGTLEAAKLLGWPSIDVVRTALEGSQATAFALADNRTGELAEWDAGGLSETLAALKAEDFDLSAIGFDADDLMSMIASVEPEGLTDPDAVPENVETRCKPGDLWTLGNHRLLCGDSTNVQHVERLMGGEKADMLLTDPPYNTNFDGKHDAVYKATSGVNTIHETKNWDAGFNVTDAALPNAIIYCHDKANFMVFTGWYPFWRYVFPFFHDMGIDWAAKPLIWCKKFALSNVRGTSTANATEPVVFAYRKGHNFYPKVGTENYDWFAFSSNEGGRSYEHPTSKPIALIQHLMEIGSKRDDAILDLFLGSGSTLIACEKTGRRCFGMEIDAHYCDVILKRWEDFTGKEAKLDGQADTAAAH